MLPSMFESQRQNNQMTSPYAQLPAREHTQNNYLQPPGNNYYSQTGGNVFYTQQSGNNSYRHQSGNSFYSQQSENDYYAPLTVNDPYTQRSVNGSYSQQTGKEFYPHSAGNDSYRHPAENKVYSQIPGNNLYSPYSGNNLYPQQPGNNFNQYVPSDSNDMRIKNIVDDLATLEVLDEAHVLNELRTRYSEGKFYTYIGDILVAINPCQPVTLYGDEVHEKYKNLCEKQKQKPHIYWIADELYRNMKDSGDDQCVVVSGDSGAGKTESIKHILNHLIRLGPNQAHELVQQLDQVNPLIELFGNASTPLNKNSSRFCKFIELQYTSEGQLQSGQIQYFIFEKSRLIQRHRNEKNFHIFYALLGWVSVEVKKQLYLGDSVADYGILVGEDDLESVYNGQEDYREFQQKFDDLQTALERVGFKPEEIINIYKVLSAILNLTNITFERHNGIENLDVADVSLVRIVAELLDTDETALKEGLLITKLNVDDIQKHKTIAEADEGRDALAKELYHHLFSCIIDKINNKLSDSYSKGSGIQMKKLRTINLLDISGFEKLNTNGFEQLLINTANEVLHQIFLNHVMKREQEEYEREGVKWSQIPFRDNADVIALITYNDTQISIFRILEDEASLLPSTDITLVQKLDQNFSENPHYVYNKTSETEFGIVHYAETVMYSAVGFIEKTKDTLSKCLKDVIYQSKNPLFQSNSNGWNLNRMGFNRNSKRGKDAGRKRNEAVTNHFKNSLRQLKTKLSQSNLMFVRCLKPNTHLKPNKFDQRCVALQLKACGLAEAANIRRDGYSVRIDVSIFVSRYECIVGNMEKSALTDRQKCQHILEMAEVDRCYIGKTKVLLNYQEKEKLENKKQYGDFISSPTSARSSFSNNSQYQGPGNYIKKNHVNNNRKINNIQEPPLVTSLPDEDINEKGDSPFSQMDQSKIPAYDAFRETERDIDDNNSFFTKLLKFCRFLFYLFIISGILASTATNRIGLFLLAGAHDRKEEHAKLFIALGIPMVFSWIFNAIRCAFRGNSKPTYKEYIFIGLLDILRTLANCVLVFLFLPTLGLFRGLVMLYGFGQVPSLLLFLETIFGKKDRTKRNLMKAIYFFVFILQVGIIPAYLTTGFIMWTEKGSGSREDRLGSYRWIIPLMVIIISLSLWENYALFDIKIAGKKLSLTQWRKRMMKVRESTNFYIEPLKIVIFWVVSWKLSDYDLVACWESYKKTVSDPVEHLRHFGIMYLEIVSAVLCSYLSGLACKLHMQKCSFAAPLILAPFVTIILSFLLCEYEWIPKKTFTVELRCCKLDFSNELLPPIIIMAVSWITMLVNTVHIWKPKSERMAQLSKLFVPLFDPLLLDYSLLFRRRQDHKESKKDMDDEGEEDKNCPTLLVCATTWHETRQEMLQILKSLFRLDLYQSLRNIRSGMTKKMQGDDKFVKKEIDNYNLEIHIIFDDAWEKDDITGQNVPNSFVKEFVSLIPEAVSSVAKGFVQLDQLTKITTPYGGRLELTMPGGNIMTIHLKNKDKIRHRKRWSQVMYFYYLLGFKLFGEKESMVKLLENKGKSTKVRRNVSILNHLPADVYKKVEKIFLLTLDGDVDFKPDSVKLLMDRMLKNKKVGAVCGRIHPIGSGPMIWYQQFEYAVGHWLQKAAEHVFGCVLCCPGCFSLFRASAVMDDNVMRAYTRKPIVARDFIQYEQGEDRWLCTLLLQQGYKIDYCAGADAYTFAPENFHDFYIQRRRWAPSTIANIMDLLSTWRTTIALNDNISVFFMFYQFILMTSSILAPATVVLMIAGSYNAVIKTSMWESFLLSLAPVILYIVICFLTKTSTQINTAALMTTIYSVVMVIVTVGTIINLLQDEWVAPNVVFLVGLSIVFGVCGILHPQEIICLVHGILYFLTVPSSFIFLTVYFLCNLNIVSWGTREVAKKLTPEEEEEAKRIEEEKQKKKKEKRFLNRIGLLPLIEEIKKVVFDLLGKQPSPDPNAQPVANVENQNPSKPKLIKPRIIIESKPKSKPKVDPYYWTTLACYGNGAAKFITPNEEEFWIYIIKKYLHPLKENKEEKEKIKKDLEMTRNNVVFGYFLLNLLWSVAIMQLQTMKSELLPFFIAKKYEPISVMFLGIFGLVLILQFFGMCMHRWGTFLHLMSTTHLLSNNTELRQRAENNILKMASASENIDIENGYSSSESYSDCEDFPPKDYDTSETPVMNLYERNFTNRMEYFKQYSEVRHRHKKTLKYARRRNNVLHL